MTTHEQILAAVDAYRKEQDSFEAKGVKAAAGRARKALSELSKLTKVRRSEIQDKKNALSAK